MFSFLHLALALAFAGQADAHVADSLKVEMTERLRGVDFLLINEAYKHREIRGRDLSCYHIRVFRKQGITTVAFLGDRKRETSVDEGEWTAITIPGPNPRCPSRSFEMNEKGKVERVIYSRH